MTIASKIPSPEVYLRHPKSYPPPRMRPPAETEPDLERAAEQNELDQERAAAEGMGTTVGHPSPKPQTPE